MLGGDDTFLDEQPACGGGANDARLPAFSSRGRRASRRPSFVVSRMRDQIRASIARETRDADRRVELRRRVAAVCIRDAVHWRRLTERVCGDLRLVRLYHFYHARGYKLCIAALALLQMGLAMFERPARPAANLL